MTAALERMSDLVVILDPDLNVVWHNQATSDRMGYSPGDLIGQSILAFLHPDDLERAAEVVDLISDGVFEQNPVAPALYRVRSATGDWVSVEINGSTATTDDGYLLLVARFAGDLVYADQLLEAVTAGVGFDRQVDLVLKLGLWRYPDEGYAIIYREGDETRHTCHGDLPAELYGAVGLPGPTPWEQAGTRGTDVNVQSVLVEAGSDVLGDALAQTAHNAGFAGCLASPVPDPGHLAGACIVIWSRAAGPTLAGHRYALDNMRRALALVLQQRAQLQALERAAHIDMLTGLLSRLRFFQILANADQQASDAAVHTLLYVDLDGFKVVNDRLGHGAGDQVLAIVARRIADASPPGTQVARIGGDEFALLCPPGTGLAEATELASRIIDASAQPIDVGQRRQARIGASVGIAVGRPGEPTGDVLDRADAALMLAKNEGRGRWSDGATVTADTGASD
ncbi:MAG: GGDEF domain-containing protein [Aquihabitans sp.]